MKMNFKKIFSGAIASVMMLAMSAASFAAYAEGDDEIISDGNLEFKYIDGGVEIVGCDTSVTELNIQERLNGYSVIKIGAEAFRDCAKLKKVTLPETVKTIDSAAFMNCYSLEEINISGAIDTLGECVFWNCAMLDGVELKGELQSIPSGTFYNCQLLTGVDIPESVTYIGASAFDNAGSLCHGWSAVPVYYFHKFFDK